MNSKIDHIIFLDALKNIFAYFCSSLLTFLFTSAISLNNSSTSELTSNANVFTSLLMVVKFSIMTVAVCLIISFISCCPDINSSCPFSN